MNRIMLEDCQRVGELSFIDWYALKDSTFLIFGSTGLIGQNLVNIVAYNNKVKKLNIHLVLPVRNNRLARELFSWTKADIIPYQLGEKLQINERVDYIVHLASPTSSLFFKEHPVDTMMINLEGTKAILEYAKEQAIQKLIYLSSMEVYGFPEKGHKVTESELGGFETMNSRNSYPIGKIATEALCHAYFSQYGVPAAVLRATQTFGPGVKRDDSRIFAQFMRCVLDKKDIILKSAGLTERSYLYTADCVSAILVALLKAEPGQAYTVANSETYCSIKEMAHLVAEEIAYREIDVKYDIAEDITRLGYTETLYMDLNIEKLLSLGWKPQTGLIEMFKRMIQSINNDR